MQPQQEQNLWQADIPQTSEAPEALDPSQTAVLDQPLIWQASEFVHHEKNGSWFLALVGIALVLLLIDIFLVKSWTFGVLIVTMTIAAGVVAQRPPRVIDYSLSLQGIRIGEKLFSFHDFRAFGVVQENAFYSIRLIPNKRFMPMVSVFFPTEMGEHIVDVFGAMLPMQHLELDPIDKLVEKLHF